MFLVDTSVVVKWVADEADGEAARSLRGEALFAPDLLRAELAHALYKKVCREELSVMEALAARPAIEAQLLFLASTHLSERALELSLELNHAAGDCFFLATAELAGLPFVTADAKFFTSCQGTRYERIVRQL